MQYVTMKKGILASASQPYGNKTHFSKKNLNQSNSKQLMTVSFIFDPK